MIQFNCVICQKSINGVAFVLDAEHIVHFHCREEVEAENNWSDEDLLKDIIEHEKEQHVEWLSRL
jgi:hypothetical protein